MTTLHTDDVRNVPDRILSMLENRTDADRMENDIYQALDVGLLIRKRKREDGSNYRYIDQMCFFLREGGENKIIMAVSDGIYKLKDLPEQLKRRFLRAGISNPFYCETLENELQKAGEVEP